MNKDTNIAAGELSLRSCIFTEQSNIGTRLPLVEEKVIFQKCFCLVKKMIRLMKPEHILCTNRKEKNVRVWGETNRTRLED